MNLPDPQILSNAQGLNVFSAAVSEPALAILSGKIKNTEDFEKLKIYFDESVATLRNVISQIVNEVEVSGINVG